MQQWRETLLYPPLSLHPLSLPFSLPFPYIPPSFPSLSLPLPPSLPPSAREAMLLEISPVVIDNTNASSWEMKPYIEMVQTYMYMYT